MLEQGPSHEYDHMASKRLKTPALGKALRVVFSPFGYRFT